MSRQITPLLRPLRTDSGTLYIFPSANEDIGLNLNNRSNRVSLSKYLLLNIPETNTGFSDENNKIQYNENSNYFNFTNIPGIANLLNQSNEKYISSSDKITIALQNYLMNLETTIVNDSEYDYAANKTVSERVFWKFLKETGAIRWKATNYKLGNKTVYVEDDTEGYHKVVQAIGQISAGNSISNERGMFNETYVNVPTTYGSSKIFFTCNYDNNYQAGKVYHNDDENYLAGRKSEDDTTNFLSNSGYTINKPAYDSMSISNTSSEKNSEVIAYVIDPSSNESSGKTWYDYFDDTYKNTIANYFVESEPSSNDLNFKIQIQDPQHTNRNFIRSRLDGVETVSSIDDIALIWNQIKKDTNSQPQEITYDSINIDKNLIDSDQEYEFNAILLYYTIYDKDTGTELATNLFGILFLNSPEDEQNINQSGTSMLFHIPGMIKRKSNGAGSSHTYGTGYSFRINIKSTSIYDNTDAIIQDDTTTNSIWTEDFNQVIYNLNKSVDLLYKNSQITQAIYNDYQNFVTQYHNLQHNYTELEKEINTLKSSKFTDIDSSNINVSDLTVNRNIKILGSLSTSENTEWNIPKIRVDEFISDNINVDNANITTVDSSEGTFKKATIDDILNADYIVTNNISGTNAWFYGGIYRNLNDDRIQDETPINVDTVQEIIQKLGSQIAITDKGKYIINPVSFDDNVVKDVSYLKNSDNNEFKVDYLNMIPLILSNLSRLNEKVFSNEKS